MATESTLLFPWKDTYSVNVELMDKQHRVWLGMINDLHQAIREGHSQDKLSEVFSNLIKYTHVHLTAEEKLLQSHGYPDFHAHKSEHDRLTAKVTEMQSRFLSNNEGSASEVMLFLGDWLIKHILGVDKKYSSFLSAKGVR